MSYAITAEDVQRAARQIEPFVHRTPLMTCHKLDRLSGRSLFFKCENFQKVGAFKFRGACNAVLSLSDEEAQQGVVTHSSGNHAQALALAAQMRGIPAYIIMPRTAPGVKVDAVKEYGGIVTFCEPTLEARESAAHEVMERTGATLIHPFNNPLVTAGQGTIAVEFLAQAKEQGIHLDAIIVPVGGGGMLSGIATLVKAVDPRIKIIAAEPLGADDCKRSFDGGLLQPVGVTNTIADGLLTSLGSNTWPIIRDRVDRVECVSEEAIIAAMKLVWTRMKIVIEPSAAVGVAVALALRDEDLERVGVVLCGGNVDLSKLPF